MSTNVTLDLNFIFSASFAINWLCTNVIQILQTNKAYCGHIPLDVPAVQTSITKNDILSTVREIREQG